MALTKGEKDVLLDLLRKLFDILYCELKQNSGDPTLLVEVFKVYCKIKKALKTERENEQ